MQLTARRTSIFERLERFAATKPAIIGLLAPRLLRRHERLVLAVYVGLWILTYLLYFA